MKTLVFFFYSVLLFFLFTCLQLIVSICLRNLWFESKEKKYLLSRVFFLVSFSSSVYKMQYLSGQHKIKADFSLVTVREVNLQRHRVCVPVGVLDRTT